MKTVPHPAIGSALWVAGLLTVTMGLSTYSHTVAGHSDAAAWGIGGLLAGHILTDMQQRRKEQTRALETMAYGGGGGGGGAYSSRRAYRRPAAAAPADPPMTPEQKLQQLNKLAAGGYITPAEYKAQRKAILDNL